MSAYDHGLSVEAARSLFGHSWIHAYGIAALCAAGMCNFTQEVIPQMLTRDFTAMMMLLNGTKSSVLTSEAFASFIRERCITEFRIVGADATACIIFTCFDLAKAGFTSMCCRTVSEEAAGNAGILRAEGLCRTRMEGNPMTCLKVTRENPDFAFWRRQNRSDCKGSIRAVQSHSS